MNKRPIMPDDLYGYQWVSQPSVHPGGTVAYVNQSIDKVNNEYITHIRTVALDGSGDERLTDGDKDSAPAWSPSGRELAFLRVSDGSKQLWTAAADGQEAVRRTSAKRGVEAFVWSPDGQYIAFTSRVSLDAGREALALDEYRKQSAARGQVIERTTPRAEGSGWWAGLFSHLFVLELGSGEVTPVTTGPWEVSGPVWSPDSQRVSFVSKHVEDETVDADMIHYADVYTIDRSGGEPVRVTDSSLAVSQFSYSPDGRRLTLIASDRVFGSGSHNRLYTVPAAGGIPELLVPELDMQLGNFALSDMKSAGPSRAPLYDSVDPGRGMYVLGTQQGSVDVFRFSEDGTYEAVTRGKDKDVYQYTLSADGRYLVIAALTADRPGELYRVDCVSGADMQLTKRNDAYFADLQVNIPEPLTFNSSEGLDIQGWLIRPAGQAAGEQAPLILQIHGGPHAMYTGTFSHEMQTLVAAGYAVLMTNPRGSFGYGQYFAQACRKDFGGGDGQDLLEAVDYALDMFQGLDEKQLGIAGGSYGGLMTNWIIAHSSKFRAAVTQRCISNWLSFYGTSDIGISFTEGIVGSNPAENAGLLWSKSPLAYAHRIETPLLIMHGENDYRCPVGQGEELYTTLKRFGKTTKLIRYPGSGHSLLKSGKPSLRVDSFEQVNAWFNEHLRREVKNMSRVQLSIPVGLLVENVLTSGAPAEVIIDSLNRRDFTALLNTVKDPAMDFTERLDTAAEFGEDWQAAIRSGYEFKFLHIGGLRRLLGFRFNKELDRDYIQDGLSLRQFLLAPAEAAVLRSLIGRQWLVNEADGEQPGGNTASGSGSGAEGSGNENGYGKRDEFESVGVKDSLITVSVELKYQGV